MHSAADTDLADARTARSRGVGGDVATREDRPRAGHNVDAATEAGGGIAADDASGEGGVRLEEHAATAIEGTVQLENGVDERRRRLANVKSAARPRLDRCIAKCETPEHDAPSGAVHVHCRRS